MNGSTAQTWWVPALVLVWSQLPTMAWPGPAGLTGLAWLGLAWPGLVWPGLALPGLAWCDLVWPSLAFPH